MEQPLTSREAHRATGLLRAWAAGDAAALEQLIPLVHDELRRLARRFMAGERAGHTLQPTALVNEAYLRLVDLRQMQWQDRAHFLAMAARLMRRILVDAARAKGYRNAAATHTGSPSTRRWWYRTRGAMTSSRWTRP